MKRDAVKQVIKECLLLFVAAYIDWMIQGERRALLKNIVLEDTVDLIMTYFAAVTLFYFFPIHILISSSFIFNKVNLNFLI